MPRPHKQLASAALKLIAPLALGIAFLAAIYVRFYSGLLRVQDLPDWPAYAAYFVLSVALWSALEARAGLIHKCFDQVSFRPWLLSLAQLDLTTLALVSLVAFFWRGYSFSRYTVTIFWSLHFTLCAAAALAMRNWIWGKNRGQPGAWILLVGDDLDREAVRRECLPGENETTCRRFSDPAAALEFLANLTPPPECREVVLAVAAGHAGHLPALAESLERLPVAAS